MLGITSVLPVTTIKTLGMISHQRDSGKEHSLSENVENNYNAGKESSWMGMEATLMVLVDLEEV